ncbi:hypothetical protein AOLI_G00325620 [Acnodon oligacanthus]
MSATSSRGGPQSGLAALVPGLLVLWVGEEVNDSGWSGAITPSCAELEFCQAWNMLSPGQGLGGTCQQGEPWGWNYCGRPAVGAVAAWPRLAERRVGDGGHVSASDDLDKAECEREGGCRGRSARLGRQCGSRRSY